MFLGRDNNDEVSSSSSAFKASQREVPCSSEGAEINGVFVTAGKLRALMLTDANGTKRPVTDVIGADGKAVVVFLRHLG